MGSKKCNITSLLAAFNLNEGRESYQMVDRGFQNTK